MVSTSLAVIPTTRQRKLGIGQSMRAWQASCASKQTRFLVTTIINQRLIAATCQDANASSGPFAVLNSTANLIVKALKTAVEHSVVATVASGKKIPLANYQDILERKRAAIKELLPSYHYPDIPGKLQNKWGADTPVSGACCLMDDAFQGYRTQVVDSVANYACELMANGLLGFTMGSNATSAYSYTLQTMELDPNTFTSEHTVDVDPTAIQGQRTTYATRSKGSGVTRHVTAEHTHHLGADAKTMPFKAARIKLPQRVIPFTRTLPEWLLPYLTITTGTIIREEIDERDQYHTEWKSDVITDQQKGSPALALGEIVLAGWSDSDFELERQTKQAVTSNKHTGLWVLGGLAVAATICILFPCVALAIARGAAKASVTA